MTTQTMLDWQLMDVPERLRGIIDSFSAGVRVAQRPDGKIVAQSFALLYDAHEDAELTSDVFTLVPEADVAPTDAHVDGIRAISGQVQKEREISAAVARSHLKQNERSPMDMIHLAQDLLAEARLKERVWQQERDRKAEEARLDAEAITAYRVWERGRALMEGKGKKS
jgi:hypothetical protein